MPERWQQPRAVQPSEPAREPFAWVGGGMWACLTCGAAVPTDYRSTHQTWHGEQPAPRRKRVTVHGVSTPESDEIPFRLLTIESGLPPEKVLDTLRAWAIGLGADLSFRESTGFRATFNPHVHGGAEAYGARLGVEVERSGSTSVVRCLLVPNPFAGPTPGMLGSGLAAASQQGRYDLLEAAIRHHIGRR